MERLDISKRSIVGLGLLAALVVGGSAALVLRNVDEVQVCQTDVCNDYTRAEYNQLKVDLITKLNSKEEMTWDEFQALVAIMDREVKQRGTLRIRNVRNIKDLELKISNALIE